MGEHEHASPHLNIKCVAELAVPLKFPCTPLKIPRAALKPRLIPARAEVFLFFAKDPAPSAEPRAYSARRAEATPVPTPALLHTRS